MDKENNVVYKTYNLKHKVVAEKMDPCDLVEKLQKRFYQFSTQSPYVVLPDGHVLLGKSENKDFQRTSFQADPTYVNEIAIEIAKKEGGVCFLQSSKDDSSMNFEYSDFVQALKYLAPNSKTLDLEDPRLWTELDGEVSILEKVTFGLFRPHDNSSWVLQGETKVENIRANLVYAIPQGEKSRNSDNSFGRNKRDYRSFGVKEFGFVGKETKVYLQLDGLHHNKHGLEFTSGIDEFVRQLEIYHRYDENSDAHYLEYGRPSRMRWDMAPSEYRREFKDEIQSTSAMVSNLIFAKKKIELWKNAKVSELQKEDRAKAESFAAEIMDIENVEKKE